MYLFFGQTVHHHSDGLIRTQRYDTEPLWLSICPILEELNILKVRDANIRDGIGYILIRGPLKKALGNTELTEV